MSEAACDINLDDHFDTAWPPNEGADRTVHIDTDPLVYSVGFAGEGDPLPYVYHSMKMRIRDIVRESGCDRYITHLSGQRNYRHDIATIQPYKGNRDGSSRPTSYDDLRLYIMLNHNGVLSEDIEADDALAIAAKKDPGCVIASIDKDLKNVPEIDLFNWNKQDSPVYTTTLEADRHFYSQCLTGDKTDHIKGLYLTRPESKLLNTRSIGPKSEHVLHVKSLESAKEMYRSVLQAYGIRHLQIEKSEGVLTSALSNILVAGPEASLRENARLLFMGGDRWEVPQ